MEPGAPQTKKIDQQTLLKRACEKLVVDYMQHKQEGWLRFMRDELRYIPDDCIIPAIMDVAGFDDTAVRSSHGVGKTAAGAVCLCTAMALVPQILVLQISPTWSQVTEVFWNEVRKWYGNSPLMGALFGMSEKAPKMWCRLDPQRWYARGLSTSNPGNIEGRHNKNVFLIVDEAKAVEDSIIQGLEGTLTSDEPGSRSWRTYWSTPSTPGGKYTFFYKSFSKHRERFKRHVIPASKSPRVSRSWIQRMYDDWGEDSQIVQARVEAEFPEAGSDILIPLAYAERFYDETLKEPEGLTSIGVDVARFGQDESVIAAYRGDQLFHVKPFEKQDTQQVASIAAATADKFDARMIVVDDIGVGGGVTDRLLHLFARKPYVQILPFKASAKARDKHKFCNAGDEVWFLFSRALIEGRTKSSVYDEKLEGQLSSYKIKYSADNRIKIIWPEKKDERLTSDSHSPDRADAVVMAWFGSTFFTGATGKERRTVDRNELPDIPMETRGIMKRDF